MSTSSEVLLLFLSPQSQNWDCGWWGKLTGVVVGGRICSNQDDLEEIKMQLIHRDMDAERASKVLQELLAQPLPEGYSDIIESFLDLCGDIDEDNIYELAANLAFSDIDYVLPSELRDFVETAFLDEIKFNNPEAMLNLGSLYYTGRIGEQNYTKAVEYYQMAYERGNPIAAENLGYCYYYGRDVEVDYEKAYHYFIKPAMAGRTESIYKIGDMYDRGLYVEQDELFAFAMYEKALKTMDDDCDVKGDVFLRMGNAYYYGKGVEIDYYLALLFYQNAETNYYQQIENGDNFKYKMLNSCIERQNEIRKILSDKLKKQKQSQTVLQ